MFSGIRDPSSFAERYVRASRRRYHGGSHQELSLALEFRVSDDRIAVNRTLWLASWRERPASTRESKTYSKAFFCLRKTREEAGLTQMDVAKLRSAVPQSVVEQV